MHKKSIFQAGMLAILTAISGTVRAGEATILVNVSQTGPALSPLQHGIFFEEINHAGDGGLYAELLRNRAFMRGAESWKAVSTAGAQTTLQEMPAVAGVVNKDDTGRGVQVTVKADPAKPGGRGGVRNEGYWGIGVQAGKSYPGTLEVRIEAGAPLKVALIAPDGTELATQTVASTPGTKAVAGTWQKMAFVLKPIRTEPKAALEITTASGGKFTLRATSLFPQETFKQRPNGTRLDLANLVADMRPSFVRFPGGCYVEGDKLANRFNWKTTLQTPLQRPGHFNLWDYYSTDGLGYHEYLQWCEDVGAEPLFVVNCGMSHSDVVPMERMSEYVQDALDAIEYARGDISTPYGKLRAQNGHPKPFNLRLMEIGNENGGPAYEARFPLFFDAIKKRYPDIQLIANTPVTSRVPDIIDEHYYADPNFFVRNATRYDRYPRTGPKIYVGEYAVTQGCGKGNLIAGLGEAAFITGMERNADIVRMASYAPLFVNDNDRKWNPDAIVYNSAQSYGTPSYWIQQMFSANRGDVVLQTAVHIGPITSPAVKQIPLAKGMVGVGTWATTADFADMVVSQNEKPIWTGIDTAKPVKPMTGQWNKGDIVLAQRSLETDCRAVGGDVNWDDYTFTCKARKVAGAEGFLIMFRVKDAQNYCWWNLGGWGNTKHTIEESLNGSKASIADDVPGRIETGRWYNIRIEVKGDHVRCYLDDKLIHDTRLTPEPDGIQIVATREKATGDVLLKVVNLSAEPQTTHIALEGLPELQPTGTALTLTSAMPTDENSFDTPRKIVPQTSIVNGVKPQFTYNFPPYSATILRLKPKQ